jgi:hypothetical protein
MRGSRIFRDRREAGQAVAAALSDLTGRSDLVVLGLPRGGIPVAAEVADSLAAPLDAFFVRKPVGFRSDPWTNDVGNPVVCLHQLRDSGHNEVGTRLQDCVCWEDALDGTTDAEAAQVLVPWLGIEYLDELPRYVCGMAWKQPRVVHDFCNYQPCPARAWAWGFPVERELRLRREGQQNATKKQQRRSHGHHDIVTHLSQTAR